MSAIADVISGAAPWHTECARAEDFADSLPAGCVSLLWLDIPYYAVKEEAWDNAWPSEEAFLVWVGEQCVRWRKVLAPNGSIYVWAKPQATRRGATMASRVEAVVAESFAVLNVITWAKPDPTSEINRGAGPGGRAGKESLRSWFPRQERVIFAEQYGADSAAMGESQYDAKCDELRGFVFEPLRAYLDGERERAGLDRAACDAACGNQMSGHYFSRVQWALPTRENYEKLRAAFSARGGSFLDREYESMRAEYEDLRREYEDLRREYEDLRRPFTVSADVPYTDVWEYPTVQYFDGKHPCQKPDAMCIDVVNASSRPGAIVADFFAGSHRIAWAALRAGRRFLGCDADPHWARVGAETCAAAASGQPYKPPPVVPREKPVKVAKPANDLQLGLFSTRPGDAA
jgi:adenine-specific DNA-methyltransferase